jgi:DivIVA protein
LLGESLITVQRFADELRVEAKKEAERLAKKAQADRQRLKAAAERELEDLRADIERLQSLERDLRANLRTLLQDALALIEDGGEDRGDEATDTALAETREAKRAGRDDRNG